MKTNRLVHFALATILATTIATSAIAEDSTNTPPVSKKQAKLLAQAKISREDAQKTALAQFPNGTVKEAELEKEHGKLIWSFDITIPGSKDIKEVNVDAKTGKLVNIETETPEQQAKEAKEDEKKKKEKDDKD